MAKKSVTRERLARLSVVADAVSTPYQAIRNSGVMVHGESPATMAKDQEFPTSIEVQLLGGDGKTERTNANLCTPGTNVVKDGKLFRPHCTKSSSKTYHGDGWVTASPEALRLRAICWRWRIRSS